MNLSGLLALLDKSTQFAELLASLEARGLESRLAILEAAKPFIVAALQRRLRVPIIVLVARPERAKAIFDQLHVWLADADGLRLFPEPDALGYERVAWDRSTIRDRLDVLSLLQSRKQSVDALPPLIIACAQAVMQKTMAPETFSALSHTIKRGQTIDLSQLLLTWLQMGFEPATTVDMPGTFSRRG
ncbi:MAG: hypothetical protein Q7O66_04470, partial [Dehalococcoidia bacterium]|nr:hypothetical protein [Dehalococcoidia bacterium]